MDIFHLDTILKINENKYLGSIDISEIAKLELHIPSVQRLEYKDKIIDIVNYQEEYFKENKCFNFLGLINICLFDDKFYIIDGQHRYKSITKLFSMGYRNEPISIEIVIVKSLEELRKNYELLNKNTPLPEFEFGVPTDNEIHNEVLEYFLERYGELFSRKMKVRRPNISRIKFEEAIDFLRNELKTTNAQTLIKQIEKENENLANWDPMNFPKINTLSNSEKTLENCETWKFYLGMFFFNSQSYCYDWVESIVRNETGKILHKVPVKRRKKTIPASIKKQSWDKYIGKELGTAKCYCCKYNIISKNDFHAGHYISEKNGGEVKVENIRPICADCNLSMGSTNMDVFMEKYH